MRIVAEALNFSGGEQRFLKGVDNKNGGGRGKLEFERAARLRDRIQALDEWAARRWWQWKFRNRMSLHWCRIGRPALKCSRFEGGRLATGRPFLIEDCAEPEDAVRIYRAVLFHADRIPHRLTLDGGFIIRSCWENGCLEKPGA